MSDAQGRRSVKCSLFFHYHSAQTSILSQKPTSVRQSTGNFWPSTTFSNNNKTANQLHWHTLWFKIIIDFCRSVDCCTQLRSCESIMFFFTWIRDQSLALHKGAKTSMKSQGWRSWGEGGIRSCPPHYCSPLKIFRTSTIPVVRCSWDSTTANFEFQ